MSVDDYLPMKRGRAEITKDGNDSNKWCEAHPALLMHLCSKCIHFVFLLTTLRMVLNNVPRILF